MHTDIAERFRALAREVPKRIVFPEGGDTRILEAAAVCASHRICEPIVLGVPDELQAAAKDAGLSLDGVELRNPTEQLALDRYAHAYTERRPNVDDATAHHILRRKLLFGAMMVSTGGADGMVAGATCPTARVIEAGALAIGLAPGVSVPSSIFIMVLPDSWPEDERLLFYADAGVNIDPTPEQLADIAVTTARTAQRTLGIEPRVAMLSCSTKGSAVHPRIDRVVQATRLAQRKAPDLLIEGEFQADAALVPRVARYKCPESRIAGRANVLIFPDLDSGNIAYKLTQYHGRARAYGPLLQGFAKPISDLSRGATTDDIVTVAAFIAVMAQGR
ncbi:MAG TPA: phosphate acetyltransferase [Planctomycetota bacterium]|nr:phosphate acetyltransferase [Planctomycetota bacterium]HRR82396.1 phosphate acetyltransferase [Planctomycetota bacterium]HRT95738.1 phosphate acetyltransferase [Planctomycetota bacterium]